MTAFVGPAQAPPAAIVGLDPSWSRLVRVAAIDRESTHGAGRTWHILDNGVEDAALTLLCVHGNPSWSFLWRNVLAGAPAGVRVIAVDQLDMGFSERTGTLRRLATRIDDLDQLTDELGVDGPVVTVAHDWGGPISLGWGRRHLEQLRGVVLLNTAVHQPAGSPAPAAIRAVRTRGLLRRITVDTSAFIVGAVEMSRPRLAPDVRRGFLAPYRSRQRREAIQDFVEDIPLDPSHPSAESLDEIAEGLVDFAAIPALLLWGPKDKVFSDLYLHDFEARLPHADVHRFPGASHFVSEDADVTRVLYDWLRSSTGEIDRRDRPAGSDAASTSAADAPSGRQPLWAALEAQSGSSRIAVIECGPTATTVTFGALAHRVERTAAGLRDSGVAPGDRVAIMIPPGVDLHVALNACWRLGAVAVLVDAGLGPTGMSRALAGAAPDHLIGITRALGAARALGWPGERISVRRLANATNRALGVEGNLHSMADATSVAPPHPGRDDVAAVVFTSGATGPSKGVVYRHCQVEAQRDALASLYGITHDDRLVAAFAPFALYGPALGIASVVPDMNVAAPGTLTATALGDAAVAIRASLVFASPAAMANVIKTAASLTSEHRRAFEQVRILLSAGAPVRPSLLRAAADLFPNATAHTPYGMTEVLPVANITLDDIEAVRDVGGTLGVCVGHPVDRVRVQIAALDELGQPSDVLSPEPGVVGEIVVRAAHARDTYDRLWHTDHLASRPIGWHRTGDVGSLDDAGRLWVGGRLGHVITAADGPVTPVAIEQSIEALPEVELAAAVGVGPPGGQVIAVVIELVEGHRRPRLADLDLLDRVRSAVHHDIAAVLTVPQLPVDRRHNSKIDRTRVATWASDVLAGGRLARL